MRFETIIEIPYHYTFGSGGDQNVLFKEFMSFSEIITSIEQCNFSESEKKNLYFKILLCIIFTIALTIY